MSTKKELCECLSDEIREIVSEIKELKAEKAKAKEAGDSGRVNSLRHKHVNKYGLRPGARHRLLALGYLRGKTYHRLEASPRAPAVRAKDVLMHLAAWETPTTQARIEEWIRTGDKTRFDLTPVSELPKGLLAQLQAGAA